jgi:hypothetical protein
MVQRAHQAQHWEDGAAGQPAAPQVSNDAGHNPEVPRYGGQTPLTQATDPVTISPAYQTAEQECDGTASTDFYHAPPRDNPLFTPGHPHKSPRDHRSAGSFKAHESAMFRQNEPATALHETPRPDSPQQAGGIRDAGQAAQRGAVSTGRRYSRQAFAPATEALQPKENMAFRQDEPKVIRRDMPQSQQENTARSLRFDRMHTDSVQPPNNDPSVHKQSRRGTTDAGRRVYQPEAAAPVTDYPVSNIPARSGTASSTAAKPGAQRFTQAARQAEHTAAQRSGDRLPKPDQETRSGTDKKSSPQFAKEDTQPASVNSRRVARAEGQLENAAGKLEKARENLPTRRKIRMETAVDENTGKAGRKLTFEKEVKSQREHLKGPLPLRPARAGANAAIALGHRKIHQVQDERAAKSSRT